MTAETAQSTRDGTGSRPIAATIAVVLRDGAERRVPASQLAHYDASGAGAWTPTVGVYGVDVGASSRDLRLAGEFELIDGG